MAKGRGRPKLERAMYDAQWGKTDLARAAGVSDKSIAKWIRGQGEPRLQNITKTADALNKRLQSLGKETHDPVELFKIG